MPTASIPTNDLARVASVRRLRRLTGAAPGIDAVLETVREQFGCCIAAVNIVDEAKTHPIFVDPGEEDCPPRADTLCALVVLDDRPVVVADARHDPRTQDNPMVEAGQVGHYYGYPVRTPDGHAAGALCVYGPGTREPDPRELMLLDRLSVIVNEQLRIAHDSDEGSRELERAHDQMALLIEHSPAAIAMLDHRMRYIAASRRWVEDYRLDGRPLAGRSHYEVFPEIVGEWKTMHQRALAGESLRCEDDAFPRADGTVDRLRWELVPWYERSGVVGGIIMCTEVRTAEFQRINELCVARERLDLAVRAIGAGTWDWDLRCSEVWLSDEWWTMLGYRPQQFEMSSELGFDMVHPHDRDGLSDAMQPVITGQADSFTHEYRMQCADGSYRWMRNCGRVSARDGRGTAVRMVGMNIDIHESRLLEEQSLATLRDLADAKTTLEDQAAELMKAHAEAEHAARRAEAADAAKSNFVANMSHEIRTPITAVLGFLDVLECESSQELRDDAVRTIRRNAEHLLVLINDILDLSRLDADAVTVERIRCEPPELVRETVHTLEPVAAKTGVTLAFDVSGDVPEAITGDPVRVRQILVNLLSNAVKFSPRGAVRVEATAGDGTIRIDVHDTGIGMTEEQAGKIFTPFTQADETTTRRFGGTGLGLTISRRLAERLGGTLVVHRTAPGEGTTMRLTLPISDPPPPRAAEHTRRAQDHHTTATSLQGARILVVDDGPDNRKLLSYYLESAGAEVHTAEHGADAIDRIERAGDAPFELVLMDMQMPVMDGYTAARTLRQRGSTISIIALTAQDSPPDRAKCLAAGCDEYAAKPIDRFELIEACTRLRGRPSRSRPAA